MCLSNQIGRSFVTVFLAFAFASSVAGNEPRLRILEGPKSLDIDLNGDGIEDFIFTTWTHSSRGYFSHSINIRDRRNRDRLHSVHVYHDGYGPDPGIRLLDSRRLPDCRTRAHFLIAPPGEDGEYGLLTAYRLVQSFPIRPAKVTFVFHRLRTLKPMAAAAYIFDGYRSIESDQEYCDVVEAVREELEGPGAEWTGGRSANQRTTSSPDARSPASR